MKKCFYIAIVSFLTIESAFCQKVKYKDLFPLLNEKNYVEGESKLRTFLSNPKNVSHPNANFQMALLLENKIKPLNIITDSTKIIKYCDSLQGFLARAKKLITDKEVRKNDQYYKAQYYRRDLRSGEFGIKSSDILSDLDDKQKQNKKISKGASFLAVNLPLLEKSQSKSSGLFQQLTGDFDNETSFALSVNEGSKEMMESLKLQNEETKTIVLNIQNKVATLPEIGFNADEDILPIKSIEKDGKNTKSVYLGNFQIWDYKQFVNRINAKVDGEISGYLKSLVDQYNKIQKKIKSIERANPPAERPSVPASLLNQSSQLDEGNFAVSILQFKEQEALYKLLDLKNEDLTHTYLRLKKYDSLQQLISQASVFMNSIKEKNTDLERKKYNAFIKSLFNRDSQVDKFVGEWDSWTKNRSNIVEKEVEKLQSAIKWGVGKNDSIALFIDEQDTLNKNLTKYIAEDTVYFKVAAGFNRFEKPLKAFISRVNPGMNLLWKYEFETKYEHLDSLTTIENFRLVNGDPEYINFLYTSNEKEYQYFTFDKQYGDEEWKVSLTFEKPVFDVKFNELTNETVIFLNDSENLEEGEEVEYIVIDKSGRIRK